MTAKLFYIVDEKTGEYLQAYTDLETADKIMTLAGTSYEISEEDMTLFYGDSGDEYPREKR